MLPLIVLLVFLPAAGLAQPLLLGVSSSDDRPSCPATGTPARGPTHRAYDDQMARDLGRMTDLVSGAASFALRGTHEEFNETARRYNAAINTGKLAFPDQTTAVMATFDAKRKSLQRPSFNDGRYNRPSYPDYFRWRATTAIEQFQQMAADTSYPVRAETVAALLRYVQSIYDSGPDSTDGQTAMLLEPILRAQLARLERP